MQHLNQDFESVKPEQTRSLKVRPTYEQELLITAHSAISRYIRENASNKLISAKSIEHVCAEEMFDWLVSHPTLSLKRKKNLKTALQNFFKTEFPSIKKKKKTYGHTEVSATIERYISTNNAIKASLDKYECTDIKTRKGINKEIIYLFTLSFFIATAITGLTCQQLFSCFTYDETFPEDSGDNYDLKEGIYDRNNGKLKLNLYFNSGKREDVQCLHLHHMTAAQRKHITTAVNIRNTLSEIYENTEIENLFIESIIRKTKEICGMRVHHIRQAFPSVLNKIIQHKSLKSHNENANS